VVENDTLITLQKAKAMIIGVTGISVSQQHVRLVLKTVGYCRNKVLVHTRYPAPKSQLLQRP